MASPSIAAQRAAAWKGFFGAVKLFQRRPTTTTALALSYEPSGILAQATQQLNKHLRFDFRSTGQRTEEIEATRPRQREASTSAFFHISDAAIIAGLRGCEVERAFEMLGELTDRRATDLLSMDELTAITGKLSAAASDPSYSPEDALQRLRFVEDLVDQVDGARNEPYILAKYLLFARAGLADEAAILWKQTKRLGIAIDGSHQLFLTAFQTRFRTGGDVAPRDARKIYLPILYELIEDGLARDLDVAPFRTLLLSLLRSIGDLKSFDKFVKAVYGVDMALPARPEARTGIVPMTAEVLEEMVRASLDLDGARGYTRAISMFEVFTLEDWWKPPVNGPLARLYDYARGVERRQKAEEQAKMKWEQGQKGRKTAAKELRLEREAKQQQHAALIAIDGPSALVSRPITLTPADTSEARALRHMTERLDHLRAPSFDLSLHSSTMYEALLEACVARGGSALAKSVFALLCKRTSNVQQMIKWAVMRDEEKGYNALPYQLLDYLVIPSTSHFRATLDAIPQDDANYIEQVYEAINEAQRALVRLRLDRDWLQERLAGVPRSTARGALDVDAYMKKLSSGIAELEAGLEAIEVDVRYGVAVFAEQAHNELQALAPTSDFPIRDTLSAKADFYSLPVRDLVSFQLKYFPVAQAALRSRWRSRILQDMRGKQARPDINQATSLIGIMAPFSSARDRWSIYPRHPYGTCAEIFASLSARSSLVYDLLYLWNGKGQRVWEVMARQPFQALPVSLRPVARLRAVLDQWPEFGRTLNAKVRYEGSRGQRSLAMTVYESTMAESIHR